MYKNGIVNGEILLENAEKYGLIKKPYFTFEQNLTFQNQIQGFSIKIMKNDILDLEDSIILKNGNFILKGGAFT